MELEADQTIDIRIGRDHTVQKIQTSLRRITPAEAASLLERCHYDRQRRPLERQVQFYAEAMRRREYYEGMALRFAEVTGTKECLLIDGQHRLLAVIESGKTVVFPVIVCHVRTLDDAWKLYYTTDTGFQRSLSGLATDIIALSGAANGRIAAAIPQAVRMIEHGFVRVSHGYVGKSRDYVLAIVRKWEKPLRTWSALCAEMVPNSRPEDIRVCARATVLSVALPTIHWQPKKAIGFWSRVMTNGALERTDPARVLNRMLADPRRVDGFPNAMIRRVAATWNAEFRGAPLTTTLTRDQRTRPVTILGTPYRAAGADGLTQIAATEHEFETATCEPPVSGVRRNAKANGHGAAYPNGGTH